MLLVWLAIAWMVGITIADAFELPSELLILFGVLSGLGSLVMWRFPMLRLWGLCGLCLVLGAFRYQAAVGAPSPSCVCHLIGAGDVTVTGYVAEDPRRTDEGQQVILQTQVYLDSPTSPTTIVPIDGLLLLRLPPYPTYHYGQNLLVTGLLKQPPVARQPNTFDYRDYLARKGIFVMTTEPVIWALPGNSGNPLFVQLLALRDTCNHILQRSLPEPQASLAGGVLLGLKASIPATTSQTFSRTGTAHLIVISGWHLSLVATLIMILCRQLGTGRAATFWLSLTLLWSYALFVGAGVSVIRAAIMASLVVLATATERRAHPWILLLMACWLMTLSDPQTLWDIGFQLSVLATASLFAFGSAVEAWLRRFPPLRWRSLEWMTGTLAATLAVQILILPIILSSFGSLSLVAPLANVLVAPALPLAMVASSIAMVAGLIWLPLGQILASMIAWPPLAYITTTIEYLANLPWAAISVRPLPMWSIVLYYILVGMWWGYGQWRDDSDSSIAPHTGNCTQNRAPPSS